MVLLTSKKKKHTDETHSGMFYKDKQIDTADTSKPDF